MPSRKYFINAKEIAACEGIAESTSREHEKKYLEAADKKSGQPLTIPDIALATNTSIEEVCCEYDRDFNHFNWSALGDDLEIRNGKMYVKKKNGIGK